MKYKKTIRVVNAVPIDLFPMKNGRQMFIDLIKFIVELHS